ncbi:MAG TPA: 16S rRNA (cytidine(1402)-2'-O)-methyltransferase [Dictyoglomaceae bacterium]|nr:16S rRNA (cytidine(1402)-2'-O)-methyltransferase [Dictyoglomaceae bacterium]HOL39095.1 16S rRNA (cytidine(1402)-2'-O)-methyltransferase [Dictyoglomaceae bacterium]HOP94296.1 16S rRNA (cytidine(1402)-2'-O)-methyltransferase [Dictyoglomaceae bacterium]HPP15249.1 16S rRNA (cytidine(1402)-2'-O)-methyltransferase [Dictyoglomaceae bacterium]HPU42655.1 16S rRNA (cytidine(1402)-2'-O)-methyltransferase [Dictyoglomaceae bacterium]
MGKLYVVATPIGNLKDITIRALEILRGCSIIAAEDTRHIQILLKAYNIENKKLISYHKYNEETRTKQVLEHLLEKNSDVVLVSDAGTPCISDPGYKIVKAARENNIEVIPIPGPSSLTATLSVSGLPTDQFYFLGFLPKEKDKRVKSLKMMREKSIKTFIVYESPKRIISLIDIITEEFPNSTVCICREITKLFEKTYYGKIEEVKKMVQEDPYKEKGEYTIVVHYTEDIIKEQEKMLSTEALIINEIIEQKVSLKDAINLVAIKYQIKKRDVYNASLKLKEIIKNMI